jgi:hypothetical protein
MTKIKRKTIRINEVIEELLKQLKPDIAHHGAGYIVEVIACELGGLPIPIPPDERRQRGSVIGAKKRGRELKGKPALNRKRL